MSTLRSLRLLGAVEAGTVTGTQLQTYLADAGRNAEFSVLLSNRGQSRRMASNTLTMTAITTSQNALNTVFQAATALTNAACTAVVSSSVAMTTVAGSTASLNVVAANPVAWGLFNTSAYYETNVRTVLANYAGVNPVSYATVTALVADPASMAAIVAAPYAMGALLASPASTTLVAASSVAMALVAANSVAINIVAAQTTIMSIIANSTAAMTEINSRSAAALAMASQPGAIKVISTVSSAWTSYQAGPFFAANLPTILANLIGVAPASYPTLDSIIADATALALVAKSTAAVQALSSNSAAMTTLANSANIGIILGSSIAMSVIGPKTSAMNSFLGASGAWPGLFSSSIAKGYIVISTALVDSIAGNAALITYLKTTAVTVTETALPDGSPTSLQAFLPAPPAKILMLGAKETGIAATFSNYNFGGTSMAGTAAGTTLALTGTIGAAPTPHVAGYVGLTWNFQGIGVTAATVPVITFFDMS